MTTAQRWQVLAAVLVAGFLIYLLAPVLTPFLISALFAYLADPLADRLETLRVPRTLAVIIVFVILILVLLILLLIFVPLLEEQIQALGARLPLYFERIQNEFLPWISATTGLDLRGVDIATIRETLKTHWQTLGGLADNFWRIASQSGAVLFAWLANLVLIPVVTFYLLRDWDRLIERVRDLIPRRLQATVNALARDVDQVLGAFLRGQLLVMIALGVIYTVGLWIVGLDLALLIGMISGLVSFVPYLGFIVGILLAGIAALMQFGDWLPLLYVVIVFGIAQSIEGMLLTPLLVGDKIGLHPVAVIFAVLAGGQLFGFVGVLLALPVAAVIMVLLRYLHRRYTDSALYSEE
jgi:predicted PurR-regulated permease PerM